MSATTAAPSIARELAARVDAAHVVEDPAQLERWAVEGVAPGVAVAPGTAEEAAAVVRLAAEKNLVLVPFGGGTQQAIGSVPERVDIALLTARLNGVAHYDPGDLTLSAGAGVTLAELDRQLAPNGQMLPLDVARVNEATLGGVLATAAQGPMRHGFGGGRDYCIGIQFVTGDGKLARAGGRVVKNVAGYDLMKLLIGSYGTLAVITSANFKVVPRVRQTATFVADFASATEALRFRDRVLHSPLLPLCFEIVAPHAHEYLAAARPARDPDQWAPPQGLQFADRWSVLVRAAGSDAVLARYRRELGEGRELRDADEAQLWQQAANFAGNVLARHRNAMVVQVGVTIGGVGAALGAIERAALDYSFLPAVVGRCGLGALVAAFVPLAVDPPGAMSYASAVSSLRAALPPEAMATVLQCPREAKLHFDLWGSTPTDIACMRAVKRAMDPANILNRGRYMV